ncbi:MAG: hypothetical protein WCR72_03580 [Bacteroidota bacterium]
MLTIEAKELTINWGNYLGFQAIRTIPPSRRIVVFATLFRGSDTNILNRSKMKIILLPYPVKLIGVFLVMSGTVFAVLYVWFGFSFSMPVFAVYSSFLETKMFVIFRTNFVDELILTLLVAGLILIMFSKEKIESENLNLVRFKAMVKAIIANNILILCSILFVYGSGFVAILVLNLFSLSVFYLCFFYFLKQREMSHPDMKLEKQGKLV